MNTCVPPFDYTISLGHVIRSDFTVSLDHVTKKSMTPTSLSARGHSLSDGFELSRDEVPLDLCSSRSVIKLPLDH